MKHLLLLMGPGGMKKPKDTTLQPRSLRKLHPVSVPTMAWTVLLLGVLAYSSGQRKGLCILGGQNKAGVQGDLVSHNNARVFSIGFRCGFSDCGDPGAVTVRVSRRDGHTHLWPELWVSH